MNEEQKNKKINYLKEQKENPTGNYRRYLVNTYNFILNDAKANGKGWSKANTRQMLKYVYEGSSDHMGYEMVNDFKRTLRDLGYIKFVKENDEWHTYIVKELGF